MAEGKKWFMLYADLIHTLNMLDDVQAGRLFKHLLAYVNDEDPVTEDQMVALAFEPIKRQLKRDLVKRETRAERSRVNGAGWWRPKDEILTTTGKVLPRETIKGLHYLYIVYDKKENEYKVGETENIYKRRQTIKRPTADLEVYNFRVTTRSIAIQLEEEIKALYWINGDWIFNEVDIAIVVNTIDSKLKNLVGYKKPDNVNVTVNDTVNVSVISTDAHTENKFLENEDDQETKKAPDEDQYDKTARVLQQRHAEHYGAYLAREWEKRTGKTTLITDGIKRRVLTMSNTPSEDIEKFMDTYAELYNFIEKHSLRKHIYYPIRQYDLEKFLEKVNSFTTDSITILVNIAVKESTSKVLALRKKENNIVDEGSSTPAPVVEQIKELTPKQKQKAKEDLANFKKNLLEKATS